jgi:hypothetical protein
MNVMAKVLAVVVWVLSICCIGLIAVKAYNNYGFVGYMPFAICLFLLGYNGRALIKWMSDD